MKIEIHTESGPGWTSYRWSATHKGGMLLSRSFSSHDEARSDAELAPSLVEILNEDSTDDALARLADVTLWLLREGKREQARSLLQTVRDESRWHQ